MKQKSLKITHIMIKAFYIILALVTVIPPIVYKAKLFDGDIITVYYFTLLWSSNKSVNETTYSSK